MALLAWFILPLEEEEFVWEFSDDRRDDALQKPERLGRGCSFDDDDDDADMLVLGCKDRTNSFRVIGFSNKMLAVRLQ